ncbi:MAG: ATP-binding cassette domain-containing protein [Candidatus Cloacimonetes bacterium]|nr:ATP-binding cassette domain-containing protein [Candidatus Cloacimonadota bacterium]
MELFRAENIVKRFSNHLALDRVTISVPQGSIYGLLGPNGAGKTTLLRIINQITAPDEGNLFFNGHKFVSEDVFNIGYLPEERGLYKKMKVGEQALYLAQLKGLPKKEAITRLKYWFRKFEILTWWNRKVEELSKGMQQKLQFIITILHKPGLLIFDEPFSGFDPINVDMLKNEILNLKKEGATIIFSTHDMGSVEQLCDHITLVDNGLKLIEGNINDIRKQYQTSIYRVGFSGDIHQVRQALNNNFELLEHINEDGADLARIKVKIGSSPNELLATLLHKVNIISFNEELPGMHDIFIRVVREAKKNLNPA